MKKRRNRSFERKVSGLLVACICISILSGCSSSNTSGDLVETIDSLTDETQNEEKGSVEKVMDYAALFENLKLTESYKGLDHTNPCMTQRFGADPYAMVVKDRVYFYMTGDEFEYDKDGKLIENSYSIIDSIQVMSTSDMVNFTDHGTIKAAGEQGGAKWAHNSWAPAAAWKEIDGKPKYFLYFADSARGIGVLTADDPAGPFTDPLDHALITKQTPNCATIEWLFDPAVIVDDDGKAYLYFGGGVPKGKIERPGTARVVELGEDMISIVGEPVVIDAPYLFEDSGIHKYNNKYYYTYCSNWQVDQKGTDEFGFKNGEIICMESDNPMGPFTFKERILKNPGEYFGLSGNNHHCVFNFQNQWYMAYHARSLEKAMGIEKGYRCTHVDEFSIEPDGTIGVIKQTLKGRKQINFVNPYEENKAVNFAVNGGISVTGTDSQSKYFGCGNMALSDIQSGDFIELQGVDFADGSYTAISANIKRNSEAESVIQVRVDGFDGQVIGYIPVTEKVSNDFAWVDGVLENNKVSGVHDLFFIFYGEGYEVESWKFIK